MTISLSESGLSSADYAAIQASTGDLAIQVKVQRYGPRWSSHSGDDRTGNNFDAIIAGTYLVRAYVAPDGAAPTIERLADETGGTQTWTALSVAAGVSDIDDDVPVSLINDGLTVRLFYYNGTAIHYTECADISSGTFGAPSVVAAVGNVTGLAATSTTFLHYITTDSQDNRLLSYAAFVGTWSTTDSDVYWPFPIHGFDAVDMGDEDLIVIATDLPPLIGSRAVGGEVTVEVNRVQGLVTFRMANDRWSDYETIDVIDLTGDIAMNARGRARLSYVNNILFASYLRRGGGGSYPYNHAGVSRSKDGTNWEFVEFVRSDDPMPPFVILPRSDYLYAVGIDMTLRSPCCTWAGQTPTEYDLTSYVIGMEAHAADMRQTTVQVSNPADVLSGTLAKSDERMQIVYDLGYTIDGSPVRMTVSTEDLTSRSEAKRLPHQGFSLETLDRLARINRIRSDFAAEWPGIQADRDNYTDPTGTGYGGLRRTAPVSGSWKAEDGELYLLSKNKRGVAMSTIVTDALNGSAQRGFRLDTVSQGEYAGIAFRIMDKDNFWAIVYDLDNDYFKCIACAGGTDTDLHTSNTMSWAVDTYYYLKIVVRYAIVTAYYSTDGITWTAVVWDDAWTGELDGVSDLLAGDDYGLWSGRFGTIGYGYSSEDAPPSWVPDDWEPPVYPPPTTFGIIVLSQSQLARSLNFFSVEDPTWTDIIGSITGTLYNIALGASNQLFVTTTDGLWYCADAAAASLSWTCIKTDAAATTDAGVAGSFQAVDVDGDTVYAPWHVGSGDEPGGYFSGTAAVVNYTQFGINVRCNLSDRMGYCIDAGDGVIACGGAAGAQVHAIGGGYTAFPGEWGFIVGVRGGFCHAWNGNIYQGYAPNGAYDTEETYFGIDVLNSMPLYKEGNGRDLYRSQIKLAEAGSVFGKSPAGSIGGRAIYTRGNTNEILWVVAAGAAPTPSALPNVAFMWTNDSFTNFHDKTGDFFTAIGNWAGASSEAHGNALALAFPYWDE